MKYLCAASLASIGLLAVPASSWSCPSDLDPSFHHGQAVITDTGPDYAWAGTVLSTGHGKVLVGGDIAYEPFVAQYTASGEIDETFGDRGFVRIHAPGFIIASRLQKDGNIVVAGTIGINGGREAFLLARLEPSGEFDPTFGDNGMVTTPIGGVAWIRDMVVLSDGRIVVVGQSGPGVGSAWSPTIAFYRPDGSLDTNSLENGIFASQIRGRSGAVTGVTQLEDDSVLVSTFDEAYGDLIMLKLTPAGELDPSFARNGIRILPSRLYEEAWDIATDSLGRIYVLGDTGAPTCCASTTVTVRRFLPDGARDRSYGRRGRASIRFARTAMAFGLHVSADGVATASGFAQEVRQALVVRFTPDGERDVSFGRAGVARITTGSVTGLGGHRRSG